MIALQVNGRTVELEGPTPLLDYLQRLGVDPRAVAVEHNGAIVERASYQSVVFREGDHVEIVRMVGGGSQQRPGRHGTSSTAAEGPVKFPQQLPHAAPS